MTGLSECTANRTDGCNQAHELTIVRNVKLGVKGALRPSVALSGSQSDQAGCS